MKTETAPHTPTPWFTSSDNQGIIVGGKRLGMMNKAEDAAYIVKAVNAHEELLDLLENRPTRQTDMDFNHEWHDRVKKAIAKAEGK